MAAVVLAVATSLLPTRSSSASAPYCSQPFEPDASHAGRAVPAITPRIGRVSTDRRPDATCVSYTIRLDFFDAAEATRGWLGAHLRFDAGPLPGLRVDAPVDASSGWVVLCGCAPRQEVLGARTRLVARLVDARGSTVAEDVALDVEIPRVDTYRPDPTWKARPLPRELAPAAALLRGPELYAVRVTLFRESAPPDAGWLGASVRVVDGRLPGLFPPTGPLEASSGQVVLEGDATQLPASLHARLEVTLHVPTGPVPTPVFVDVDEPPPLAIFHYQPYQPRPETGRPPALFARPKVEIVPGHKEGYRITFFDPMNGDPPAGRVGARFERLAGSRALWVPDWPVDVSGGGVIFYQDAPTDEVRLRVTLIGSDGAPLREPLILVLGSPRREWPRYAAVGVAAAAALAAALLVRRLRRA
jgi:hypothetical protein